MERERIEQMEIQYATLQDLKAIANAKKQGREELVLTCKDKLIYYYVGFGIVKIV